ncbi:hypothetical protein Y1Q_0022893 [Alligator mississippiensis]|uniref:Uncharacterized protein n=1 Tax=Alligator mississippiensis TaxID=8496 RepID=A0A151N4Z9_ALLMI|nr:hypothetical protein Y1Q_0022893 [Alligator mississippiensis]
MPQLRQRRTQNQTLLLDHLVTASKEQLMDSRAWRVEDVTQQDTWWVENVACKKAQEPLKEARDWVEWEFWERLLALEGCHNEALQWQAVLVARAAETMEEDHQVLDTILALVVTFVLPAALLPAAAPLAPWQLLAIQQQAPPWAWAEVQH